MCPWLTDLQRLMIEMLSHLLKYGYIPAAQHGPKMALFLVLVFFSSIISYCPSMPCTACVPYRCSVLQAWSASYDGSSCTCLPLYGRAFLPAVVVQLKLALKSLLQAEHVNFIGQSISLPGCRQMPPLSLPCALCLCVGASLLLLERLKMGGNLCLITQSSQFSKYLCR